MMMGRQVTPERQQHEASLLQEEDWTAQRLRNVEGTMHHLESLLASEKTKYTPCMDYLADMSGTPADELRAPSLVDRVNEAWRRKLCEWCFEVVDHFNMEREVVSVAMNYLDRVIAKRVQATGRTIPKREFQLVAVTCLYIAIKLHGETEAPEPSNSTIGASKLNIDVFVELSRGFFQAKTIEDTELTILFALDWNLNPPTPLKFISSYVRLIPTWTTAEYQPSYRSVTKAIFDIAMYLTELSVCVSTFSFHSKNSIVAYAAILCAMDALEETLPLPYDFRLAFLKYVAQATGLTPSMQEVRCVRSLLTELCPALMERDVASLILGDLPGDDDGSASPVCVSHGVAVQKASSFDGRSDFHVIEHLRQEGSEEIKEGEPLDEPKNNKRGRE